MYRRYSIYQDSRSATASGTRSELRVEPADSPASLALQEAFFADIATRYPGWRRGTSQAVEPSELAGAWVVAYVDDAPIGCGDVQALDREIAEIRRIYLTEKARGRGIGRGLLDELERRVRTRLPARAADHGRQTTGGARALAFSGYEEIAPFTDGAFTSHWMEKSLTA